MAHSEDPRPSSSQSHTPAQEESTIDISVKVPSGETIPFTLPTSTSIPTLLQLLSLRITLPTTTLRLTHAGKAIYTPSTTTTTINPSTSSSLENKSSSPEAANRSSSPDIKPEETPPILASLNLESNATLTLAHPPVRSTPKKTRCGVKGCRQLAQRIVGDCGFCDGHFCGNHRMLEDHRCVGLEDCKNQSREQNRVKLESERTMMLRGI